MAKYRYRIEGGRYGGELVVGETNPGFALHYGELDDQAELIEAVLDADGSGWNNEEVPEDALIDPNQPPGPGVDEYFNMWENDELEHCNGPYSDGGFTAYEVPADGSDDWDYDKEVYDGEAIHVYGREGAYFGREEPTEDIDEYIPVLAFHSSEKGTFGCWFLDTDEEVDRYKLGFGILETNLGEFVDRVYYNKEELETNYDYNDTTGKSYHAEVGWLNTKWHDPFSKYDDLDEDYLAEFDENANWEREQNEV